MDYYWHLIKWDGEVIKVKPEHVQKIKAMLSKGSGSINTVDRVIVIKDVKDFVISGEMYSDQKLIEASAQAFNEPILTGPSSIAARYVKKSVPRRLWEKHYRFIDGYRLLEENDSFMTVAFKLATHDINHQFVQELSQSELLQVNTD